ncbi:type II toxin-antitoxin system Phd/YefM family antitoxin [Streptomyces vastus]|uniref:type II toxin-antitoxin system Phd/YefM family antitoxin n=1 Tax=Streptomyces vastus TaxID=285451 RepID=UPI003CD0593C
MRAMANLMSAEDFAAWQETNYLLRSPANARRLMEAAARDQAAIQGSPSPLKSSRNWPVRSEGRLLRPVTH